MRWMQDNWLMVFTVWVAVNTVVSPIAAKVPATGFWGKLLHVFVAVSPMDLMKAIKTVGASVTVPLACLALLLLGCASVSPLTRYHDDSLACVAKAATRAQADACLLAVAALYCGDGGALVPTGACSDGGAP